MLEVLKKCFSVNLNDYENIGFSLEINKVLVGAFGALIVGVILLNLYRASIRLTVMQLTRHGATDEESAKTLRELGLDSRKSVKRLLGADNMLTKIVGAVGKKEYTYEEYRALSKEEREKTDKMDFDTERFYIRKEQSNRATFVMERYITSPARTALVCVFIGLVLFCLIACMPGILNVIDSVIGSIRK